MYETRCRAVWGTSVQPMQKAAQSSPKGGYEIICRTARKFVAVIIESVSDHAVAREITWVSILQTRIIVIIVTYTICQGSLNFSKFIPRIRGNSL